MAEFYMFKRKIAPLLVGLCCCSSSIFAINLGGPKDPDSLSRKLGHCSTIIVADTICSTHQITLSAYVDWTWTGVHQPISPVWSNGIQAHKITVTPPGTWSWDTQGFSCEVWHTFNEFSLNVGFFEGPIEISGPTSLCSGDDPQELTLNINGYSNFASLDWMPENPTGLSEPYLISEGGTYSVSVTDALGCTSSDQITVTKVPAFTPAISGPTKMCPEGDSANLNILNPALYASYEWATGETTSPIIITEPGDYQVTATDTHGCTGVGSFGVQSAGVDPFAVSASSPTLCPGQSDTLRVLGGYSSYIWSNNVSGITNVVQQAGTYTVTVTNSFGCSGTTSVTVQALFPPVIQVSGTPLCLGDTAILSATGGNFAQYAWSNGQNTPSITVLQPGAYSVTVSGGGICATSTNSVLNWAAAPVVEIAPPATLNCLVLQTPLDGSNSSNGPNFPSYWTSPNGHIVSGDSTLNPIVDAPGTYILSIQNDSTGCFSHDTVVVAQNTILPPADAGNAPTLTCAVTQVNLGPNPAPANPDLIPVWSPSGTGNIVAGSNSWSPTVDQPGVYWLTVTDAINGCTSTSSVTTGQDTQSPDAQIATPDLITCMQSVAPLDGSGSSSGLEFTYLWTSADGIIVGPTDAASVGASAVGTYNLLVTNTINGCTASTSATVSADVNIPVVSALPPGVLTCADVSTMIDASASSSGPSFQYQWTTLNGHILTGENTLNPAVDAPGLYTLHLLNTANDCAATLAVSVQQNIQSPLANAGQNAVLNCAMPSLILDGTGSSGGPGFTYQWSTQNGNIVNGANGLNPLVNADGLYTLQVQDLSNGCTAISSVQILNDANAPSAVIAPAATLNCIQLQTTLDASASSQNGNLSYQWSGNGINGQSNLQVDVNQPGTYTLLVTDLANGCTDLATVLVQQDITPPPADAGINDLLNCYHPLGSIGSLSNPAGAGFTLQWSTSNGHFVNPANAPEMTVDQAGDYHLLVTNTQNGCTATDDVTINADFAPPVADAGATSELTCVQTTYTLQGSGSTGANFMYQWTASNGGHIVLGGNTLSPLIDDPGTYNLLITNNQNGCTAASQVDITEDNNGPTAAIASPQTLTCVLQNTTLNATASSAGPAFTYAWSASAGGNITGGGSTPTPVISTPGVYTITVTDSGNLCTQTASVTVAQNIQSPTVEAVVSGLLTCIETSLSLDGAVTNSSSNNLIYLWSTGNGQILSGGNTQNPLVGQPGFYQVQVTDQANGCIGVDQVEVMQDITAPTLSIANPPILTCNLPQLNIDATAGSTGNTFTYAWSTANGHFVSQQNPQSPVVDQPGNYNLLITNTSNGCIQSGSVTVAQDIQAPTAAAGQSLTLDCDTPSSTLDGSGSSQGSGFSYQWSTSNGQILSGGNTLAPLIGAPGLYTISVLNIQNGCTSMDDVLINQDIQHPALLIAPPQTLTCILTSTVLSGSGTGMGNLPSISWSTNNGHILQGTQSLNPVVDAPGVYTLTVQNQENGCSSSVPVSVAQNVQSPSIQIQPAPLLTCSVQEFALQGSTAAQVNISWSTANGHIASGANTLQPVVDAPGTYAAIVTSTVNGCTQTAEIVVNQEQNIPNGLHFSITPPLCNGTPGSLDVDQVNGGIGPYAYSVDGGQTFFGVQAFHNLSPGQYDLVVQDANGCEVNQAVVLPAPPLPAVSAPPSFQIALGENQEIQALVPSSFPLQLVDTVIWSPMDGLTFSGSSTLELLNPVAQPYHSTTYTVTIVTKEGCSASARTLLRVDREVDIYAPNVIWPEDPDGQNAVFTLFARDESIALIKKLQIFDRWGSLLFENKDFRPNDTSAGWSGESKGEPVNPAVFVWWAEVELVDGREIQVKGDVTVVR